MSDDLTPAAAILTAAFSRAPATAAAAPSTPAPTAPPSTMLPGTSGPQAELSSTEAATMTRWFKEDLAKGRITPEQAAKAFAELGATPDQLAPDERSDDVKALDVQFPPAKTSDYTIRYAAPGQVAPPMSAELKAFDQSARTWLSEAGLTREHGNSLISAIDRVAQKTKGMSASELESFGLVEYARLEQTFGSGLEDKLRSAGQMVEALDAKTPGLKNLLKRFGDSAMVASLLIQQSERWHARRKGR